jgi:uncharacterized tellurite resistance protein B-like protein
MANSPQQLLKILIGVAWLDGQVQAVEREHLISVAEAHSLAADPEISQLLSQLGETAIPATQCYQWVQEYLGNQPDLQHYEQLLDALSGIIYSDNDVATAEAQLLNDLQQLDPRQPSAPPRSPGQSLLAKFRTIYRQWVAS